MASYASYCPLMGFSVWHNKVSMVKSCDKLHYIYTQPWGARANQPSCLVLWKLGTEWQAKFTIKKSYSTDYWNTKKKNETRDILKHSSISKDQQRRLVVSACYGLIRIPASGIDHIYKNKSNGLANKLTEVVKELRRLIWLLLEDNLEAHYSYIKQSWSAHWRNTVRFISEDRTHHKDYAYDTT